MLRKAVTAGFTRIERFPSLSFRLVRNLSGLFRKDFRRAPLAGMTVRSSLTYIPLVISISISFFSVLGLSRAMAASDVVEIFYLPHPPAVAVVEDVEGVLKKYPRFKVEKYSFEDPKNRKLLSKYNLREHMPVVIFINGKNEFVIGNKKVIFKNFPKGNAFVPMLEGNWSYQDFESILLATIRGK